jgi:hypothetical protein
MNETQFEAIENFRKNFKKQIKEWEKQYPDVEFVYNKALDKITEDDEIEYIIVGDNPGKEEKAKGEYLVGKAGKFCRNFFKNTLDVEDFNNSVIVLNKTPIFTEKTTDLKNVSEKALEETQEWMAKNIAKLHQEIALNFEDEHPSYPLWIVGLSQLKPGGLFSTFATIFKNAYPTDPDPDCETQEEELFNSEVLVFKHFSYGRFSEEFKKMEEMMGDLMGDLLDQGDYDSLEEALEDDQIDIPFIEETTKWKTEKDVEEEDDAHVDEKENFEENSDSTLYLRLIGGYHKHEIFGTKWTPSLALGLVDWD